MKDRLKMLRKDLGMTQEKFAERLKMKRNTIATYEIGRNEPIDAVISLICKEFNVNDKWLRTGEGNMYNKPKDDVAEAVSDLLEKDNPLNRIIINILSAYRQMDDASQKALDNLIQELFDNMKKRD